MSPGGSDVERCAEVTRLWEKFNGQIYGYLIRLGVPAEAAEEIVVDAFSVVYRRWDDVGRYDRPESFVYKVANNIRRWRYGELTSQRAELDRSETNLREVSDDLSLQTIIRTDVWSAVNALPPRCREVVVLRYAEDLTVAETAEVLGIAPGTVKAYTAEARSKLAGRLSDYDPGREPR